MTLDQWKNYHSIAFATWLATQPSAPGSERMDSFLSKHLQNASVLPSYVLRLVLNMVSSLCARRLHRLDPLRRYTSQGFRKDVMYNLSKLHGRGKRVSIARASRVIADAILYETPSIHVIPQIARRVWPRVQCEKFDDVFNERSIATVIHAIRNGSLEERLSAVNTVASGNDCSYFSELAFRLYDGVFVWPLVVFGSSSRTADSDPRHFSTGFAFPVGVDVDFPLHEANTIRQDTRIMRAGVADAGARLADWEHGDLKHAVLAAKRLFKLSCGYCNDEWKRRVDGATVTFNFSYAENIASPIEPDVAFGGASATPFFATATFGRFVYSGNLPPIALTAEFDEKSDYSMLTAPEECVSKLEWTRIVDRYHRVIIPLADGNLDDEIGTYLTQFSRADDILPPEVVRANSLAVAAHAILPGVYWQRYLFCRTPDIRWSLLNEGRSLAAGDANGIERATEFLRCPENREKRVLRWDKKAAFCTAADLAVALDQINRHPMKDAWKPLPPKLRLAFVRLSPEDEDRRAGTDSLLSLVGGAIGFPGSRLCELLNETPEKYVEAIMDRTSVSAEFRFRSPDILVVITSELPAEDSSLYLLMDAMERRLGEPPRYERWSDHIGNVRVIFFVEEDVEEEAVECGETLEKLRVFRYGFTQQMASRVTGKTAATTRSELQMQVKMGVLRVIGGHYHFAAAVKGIVERSAKRTGHYDAARSLLPLMNPGREPSVIEAESRQIEYVREAAFHLGAAIKECNDVKKPRRSESVESKSEDRQIDEKRRTCRQMLFHLNWCYDMTTSELLRSAVRWGRGEKYELFWNEVEKDFLRARRLLQAKVAKKGMSLVEQVRWKLVLVELVSRYLVRTTRSGDWSANRCDELKEYFKKEWRSLADAILGNKDELGDVCPKVARALSKVYVDGDPPSDVLKELESVSRKSSQDLGNPELSRQLQRLQRPTPADKTDTERFYRVRPTRRRDP